MACGSGARLLGPLLWRAESVYADVNVRGAGEVLLRLCYGE